jgi:solute:Na+ symporter, SSS family
MLHAVDWVIIGLYFLLSAAIGVYFTRRAGSSIQEFFLSGRNLPWWLAGTSMVATTFAADTPLAVTELVAKNGIAGNWLWWNFVLGGVLTVFFFARLWRRAGILTDVEFVELRYSGRPAAFLRGFRALYLGLFINTVIIGWVNLAMASVLEGMFGIPPGQVMIYVALSMALTALYSALSGLWGVAVTDAFQFVLAMTGTIVLAVVVLDLPQVGGMAGLLEKVPGWSLSFFPVISQGATPESTGALTLGAGAFFAFVGIQWWACWYPGAEPGGGGYVAQRMMSAKDERHSLFATLWFTVAHYCVRPWPWIIVGLATLVLYPDLGPTEKRLGYVYAMRDFLPPGFKGMLVASFFAAYMSTLSTQFNWGTSYIINDFYRRFVRPDAPERHLVAVSRIATLAMMALSLYVTSILDTISGAWAFIIEAGAGLGLVLILRWFWWRINAWSEIAAMVTPLVTCGWLHVATEVRFPQTLYTIVAVTTFAWLVVTFLTKPTDAGTLARFYRRVHPGGAGWRALAEMHPDVKADSGYGRLLRDWLCGTILVYSVLFGVGKILLLKTGEGLLFLVVAAFAAWLIWRALAGQGSRNEDRGTRKEKERKDGIQ